MDDLLDFDEENKMGDYLWVNTQDLGSLIELFKEHHVDHRVREVLVNSELEQAGKIKVDELIFGVHYVVQIPINLKTKVDDLLVQHPEVFNSSEEVRKVYLEEACDDDDLIEILLFPEDWEKGDPKLALNLLHKRGVQPSDADMERVRINKTNFKAMEKRKVFLKNALFVIGLVLTFLLLYNGLVR